LAYDILKLVLKTVLNIKTDYKYRSYITAPLQYSFLDVSSVYVYVSVKSKRKLPQIVNVLNVGHCATLMVARRVSIVSSKSEKKMYMKMWKLSLN